MPFPDRDSVWTEQHPDEGMLHEWLEEQLDTEAAARVAAHVSVCETCRSRVAEAHGLIAASRRILTSLDDVPGGVIPAVSSVARVTRDANITANASTNASANTSGIANISGKGVAAADLARSSKASTAASVTDISSGKRANTAKPNAFRWRRWGSIAAVLVLGVTGVLVVNKSGNVSVLNAVANHTRDSSIAAPAPVAQSLSAPAAANASATPRQTNSQAANADSAAKATGTSAAREAQPRDVKAIAKRAPADASVENFANKSVQDVAQRREASRNEVSAAGIAAAGAAQAAAPPIVSSSTTDTLSQRLESERRKAAAAEAVAADPKRQPRIDAIVPATQGAPEKSRAMTMSAPRAAPPIAATAASGTSGSFAPLAFDSLTLVREPCFGRCPSYELMVNRAGHVRYRSHHPNDNGHEDNADLSANDIARLHALIERSHVDSLKSYMPDLPTCGQAATDMPTLHLSVFRQGRTFKLDQYMGCSAGTKVVPNLMREIDSIAGTQRWLPAGYKFN